MHTPMERPIRNAILRIHDGNIETGWSVRLLILNERNNTFAEATGRFLPAIELREKYHIWESRYLSWGRGNRWFRRTPVPPDVLITHSSTIEQCQISTLELERELDQWLRNSTLEQIRLDLVGRANPENVSVKLVIQTNDPFLQKLPWHRSSFFQTYYSHQNISFCINEGFYDTPQLTNPINILAVLGSNENIEIEPDLRIIQRLPVPQDCIDHNLDDEGNIILYNTKQQLFAKLRERGWQIFFYAGHSYTDKHSEGYIYLNNEDGGGFSFRDLTNTLAEYIGQNLKLIIINSCDGIGLAHQLIEIGIPNVIVMAQPIHDAVAHKFLEAFLDGFANQRLALDEAVQLARHILHEQIEDYSPCASWMPLVFQRSSAQPAIYYPLPETTPDDHQPPPPPPEPKPIWQTIKRKIGQIWRSIRRNKFFLFIVLPLLIALSIYIPHFQDKFACDFKIGDNLSCGEESILYPISQLKQQGIEAYRQKDYELAADKFEQSFQQDKDPESLIDYLNSTIERDKLNFFTFAVLIPYTDETEQLILAMLKATAQYQKEYNENPKNTQKLMIVIANEANDPDNGQAIQVVKDLVRKKDNLVAVVGPYASRVAKIIKPFFNQNLVFVSGQVTSSEFTDKTVNTWFFRITNTTEGQAIPLIDYLKQKGHQKVGLFYSDNAFSASFKNDFKAQFEGNAIKGNAIDVLLTEQPNILEKVTEIKNQGATAIIICPDVQNIGGQIENTKEILSNSNNIPIGGCNTLYSSQYAPIIKEGVDKGSLDLAVSLAVFPDDNIRNKYKELWDNEKEADLVRYSLSYDAIKVVTDAVNQLISENKPVNTVELQKILVSKFKTEGITGAITFNGSERVQKISVMAKSCKSTDNCDWQKIE